MPTLPCVEELEEEQRSYIKVVSQAVQDVVKKGQEDDRVILGIPNCIGQLKSDRDSIMLCLLIQVASILDPDLTVPLVLIKALCLENDIHLLHLQGEDKSMTALLSTCLRQSAKCRNIDVMPPPTPSPQTETGNKAGFPLGCMMIKYPKDHLMTDKDDLVLNYCRENVKNCTEPTVMIPQRTEAGLDKNLGFKLKTKKVKMASAI